MSVIHGISQCSNDDCKWPTRPSKWKPAEAPGTRARHARGLCTTCWARQRRSGVVAEPMQDIKAVQHQNNVSGLEAYMADRRRRGVPAEGIRFEYELEDAA